MIQARKAFLFILALLLSYFLIPYSLLWGRIDEAIFKLLNQSLLLGKPYQIFWAALNHKYHDWLIDFVFIGFFVFYIFKPNHKTKNQKSFECILSAFFMFCVIFFVNKIVFRNYIDISSLSPSLKFQNYIHINRLLPFFKTKVYSHSSFPGDHATTAFLFFFLTAPLFTQKAKRLLAFYVVLVSLPRLMIGAHNFSDIFVGSMSIALFFATLLHIKQRFENLALKLAIKFLKQTI